MIEMRKHLLWYFRSFPGASKLRQELAKVNEISELEAILKNPDLQF
jgi:tRNA-dihydrouridine synthase